MNTQKLKEIAARIQVVTLNQGVWSPVVTNRNESAKVNAAHHAVDLAKVLVTLTHSPTLIAINTLKRETYQRHIALTRPSIIDGMRIVRTGFAPQHAAAVKYASDRLDELVDAFALEYVDEKRTAPARMNGLYNPADWPEVSEIRKRFYIQVRYMPCPVDGAWSDWLAETCVAAEAELADQFTAALRRLIINCKGDGRLYATTFTNLKELVELLPATNITELPALDTIAPQLAELGALDAETLRTNTQARREAAAKAERLLGIFGTNQ